MVDDKNKWHPKRKHRRHLYYKVQVFDAISLTWLDLKDAFDDIEEARAFIRRELVGRKSRVMEVDGRNRRPLE